MRRTEKNQTYQSLFWQQYALEINGVFCTLTARNYQFYVPMSATSDAGYATRFYFDTSPVLVSLSERSCPGLGITSGRKGVTSKTQFLEPFSVVFLRSSLVHRPIL